MNNYNSYIEKYKFINNINKLNDNNTFQFPNITEDVEKDFKILDSLIKTVKNDDYQIKNINLDLELLK
jgi:hypothetical protein